jgi:transposase-like protein
MLILVCFLTRIKLMKDRVWRGEEFWRAAIEAQPEGGQSVSAYCRQRELSANTFYKWRRKFRGVSNQGPPVQPTGEAASGELIELVLGTATMETNQPENVSADQSLRLVEVTLPGGVSIRLHGNVSPNLVSQFVWAAESPSGSPAQRQPGGSS